MPPQTSCKYAIDISYIEYTDRSSCARMGDGHALAAFYQSNAERGMMTKTTKAADPAQSASKAPAIARAAAILRLLSKSQAPLGVQAIATELGLVPSTCLHVLRALVAEHFVAFNPATKHYTLEAGVLTLAQHWLGQDTFNGLVQPVLNRVSREFNVTMVGLRIASPEQSIVVAVAQWDLNLRLTTQVGSVFPSFSGATGRALAAHGDWTREELRAHFAALTWDNPPTFDEWLAQVERTREQGFALDKGTFISGVTVVLAPVWESRGEISHALIAFGISDALKAPRLKALQSAVVKEARALTQLLRGGDHL